MIGVGTKAEVVDSAPLASIVVVTKNRCDSLARTLAALEHLEYPSYEVLVVDHGSTDDTTAVVERFGVQRIECPTDLGIAGCRQLGAEAARGEIVAMCDDDCVPVPRWLRHIQRRLGDPTVGLVGGRVINRGFPPSHHFKGRTRLVGPNGCLAFAEDPATAEFFGNANLAFRKSTFMEVGGYDTFFHTGAEIDLALTFRSRGYRVVYEPEAEVEHFFTGVSFKRTRLLYGSQLMRLYRHLKHDPPRTAAAWVRFWKDEARLLAREVWRSFRRTASSLKRRDLRRLVSAFLDLFNGLVARLAVPWLLYRARNWRREHA